MPKKFTFCFSLSTEKIIKTSLTLGKEDLFVEDFNSKSHRRLRGDSEKTSTKYILIVFKQDFFTRIQYFLSKNS